MIKSKAPRLDIYQRVTNQIITQLEEGRTPWVRPWDSEKAEKMGGTPMPRNAVSGKKYNGINVLLLWGTAFERGYQSGNWVTFNQAKALGGHVREGEKSTVITYASKFVPKDEQEKAQSEDREERQRAFLKTYLVFNVEQCEGLPEAFYAPPLPVEPSEQLDIAEAFIANTKASIRIGGSRAFYSPNADYIQLVPQAAFEQPINYYRTAFHELGHWTGHKSRLNRDQKNKKGSEKYAFEELVAEISAAFTCSVLGIIPTVRHADYIGSWLEVLKNDKRAIFKAASLASASCDYLHDLQEGEEEHSEAA